MTTLNLDLRYAVTAATIEGSESGLSTLDATAFGMGNNMMEIIESVLTDRYEIAITTDYIVTNFELYLFNLVFTSSTLLTTTTITFEDTLNITHLVTNSTNEVLLITTASAAAAISIPVGEYRYIYFNAGTMIEIYSGGHADFYNSNYFKAGTATNSQDIVIFPLSTGATISSESITAYANTAALALSEYDIFLDAGLIGDINFSAGVNLGVTSIPVPVEASAGQVLKITTPVSADANIADIGINIELRT